MLNTHDVNAVRVSKYALLVCAINFGATFVGSQAWAQKVFNSREEAIAYANQASVGSLAVKAVFMSIILGLLIALWGYVKRQTVDQKQPMSQLWFSVSGRLSRKSYWIDGVLVLNIIVMAAKVVVEILSIPVVMVSGGLSSALMVVSMLVYVPLGIFLIWGTLVILTKRAHDLGISGWMLWIPFYGLWVMFKAWFFPGMQGSNVYGADPMGEISQPRPQS